MTPSIVAAIEEAESTHLNFIKISEASEPPLDNPAIGNPISHGQIIALSKFLRKAENETVDRGSPASQVHASYHLDDLLRGARIYTRPPKPKAEPVS